jgi:hypothetical protein
MVHHQWLERRRAPEGDVGASLHRMGEADGPAAIFILQARTLGKRLDFATDGCESRAVGLLLFSPSETT